jgi:mRNA-degrading endonuclease RelE of RelBE toxin-antitoxin system
MDKIEKLLRKISKKSREKLFIIIEKLLKKENKSLNIKKLKGTSFYRLRSGRFRIIFHYEGKNREIVIDSIKIRNENTYKTK